jgi:hypothetical protein
MPFGQIFHAISARLFSRSIDPDSHSVTTALSVPESVLERLDALATKHDWNRAEAVREAIRGLVCRK